MSRFSARLLPLLACLLLSAAPTQAQSIDELRSAAQSNRRDAAAQTRLGVALRQAGSFAEAERVLRAAARLQGNALPALFEVARVAFAQNDYRKARAACRLLEREERNAGLTHVCRARAFLVWNRSGRAFEELEAAQSAGGAAFETSLALGDAHRLRAATTESEQAYRAAIQADGSRAEPHAGLGQLFLAAGRRDEAVAAFREAHRLDSGDPSVSIALGQLVGGAEGRTLLANALARRPGDATAEVALGNLALGAGDHEAAVTAFRAAVEHDAHNAGAFAGLGNALAAQGQYDEARLQLEQALELVPSDATVVLALGRLAEQRGDTQEAFRTYRHAADLNPGNPEGLLAAAQLALRDDRAVLATGILDRLLQRHANLSAALELYGDALAAQRDRTGAARYYERALSGTGPVNRAAIEEKRQTLSADRPAPQRRRAVAP